MEQFVPQTTDKEQIADEVLGFCVILECDVMAWIEGQGQVKHPLTF